MRAILIKTDERKIEEVDFDGSLDHLYKLLNIEITERVTIGDGIDLWVDEEGLINGRGEKFGFFRVRQYDQILAGRGLVTGETYDPEEGGTFGPLPTEWTVEKITANVYWKP